MDEIVCQIARNLLENNSLALYTRQVSFDIEQLLEAEIDRGFSPSFTKY